MTRGHSSTHYSPVSQAQDDKARKMAPNHHNFEMTEELPPARNLKEKIVRFVKFNALTLATIGGVFLGGMLGFLIKNTTDLTAREKMYVAFPGTIFLQMLKALIIPLIMSCLISAIASLDLSLSGKVASRAIGYYLTTTFASVVLGQIVVMVIQPGVGRNLTNTAEAVPEKTLTVDTLLDLLRNMFAPNIIEATIFQIKTNLTPNDESGDDLYKYTIGQTHTQTTNILGLVVAAAAIGIALAQLGKQTETMANFWHDTLTLMMKITSWIISISPVGVCFLVCGEVLKMDDVATVMKKLGLYFVTVMVGLSIQGFVILPILFFALTRRNPFHFIKGLSPAIIMAFGTGSSTATLPLTIKCIEENLGIDPRIARFTLPIGSTINMDGTALYEAVAAIFIAQVRGVPMSMGRLIAISITATAASIGAAGIPQAGLVTMVMVLDTLGLPAGDVTIILAVDWLLDRFRTAINVMGDAFGSGVVHYRSQKELQTIKAQESRTNSMNNIELKETNNSLDPYQDKP